MPPTSHESTKSTRSPHSRKGFARTNRRLQCLQPAKEFTPPTKPPTGKRKPPEPYPGTRFGAGIILRASAAINDGLRQLGHLGVYETPDSLPDLEQMGIWLHHAGATCIPLVIRLGAEGTATAYLASDKGTAIPPIPYEDLPEELANGKGRIRPGPSRRPTSPVSCATLSAPATAAARTPTTGSYSSGQPSSSVGWSRSREMCGLCGQRLACVAPSAARSRGTRRFPGGVG